MNLLEILKKEIIDTILPSDVYAIIMLISTLKTVKETLCKICHKVDVHLKN